MRIPFKDTRKRKLVVCSREDGIQKHYDKIERLRKGEVIGEPRQRRF